MYREDRIRQCLRRSAMRLGIYTKEKCIERLEVSKEECIEVKEYQGGV